MAVRLLGGGSTLNTVISDMNTNLLDLQNDQLKNRPYVVKEDYVTGTAVAGSLVTIPIAHGLDYEPQAIVYMEKADLSFSKVLPAYLDVSIGSGISFATYLDWTTAPGFLFIQMFLGSTSTYAGPIRFKYQLLSNRAN